MRPHGLQPLRENRVACDPTKEVVAKVRETNATVDALKLDTEAQVHVLDLWKDFTNADSTLKTELYSDQHVHLGPKANR